jgi:signal transduction histidine kinase
VALPLEIGAFALTILSGMALCWLGLHSYRRWTEPGVIPFAAFAVLLGLGGISGGILALSRGATVPENNIPMWAELSLTGWVLAMVPWILFALQYTGRYTRFRVRTVAILSTPVVGIVSLLLIQAFDAASSTVITQILGTFALLYVFALVAVGSYLLLRTSYEYGHLSLFQGVSLTFAGIGPLMVINSLGMLSEATSEPVISWVYSLAFVTPAAALMLAVFHYEIFESTPAAGTLGERAISRETDDLIFVVDEDSRVITINETAAETLAVSPTAPLGKPFTSLIGTTVEDLQEMETVELETKVGIRKFDPQVTAFTDQHDRPLGRLVSLRDVTKRELRKQRLEVLNRVLRHNLRNRVDVIKGNAEAVASESNNQFADSILDSADELATLSSKARSTDRLVSRPLRTSEDDLAAVIGELIETDAGVNVTLNVPDTARLVTDWEALRAALKSAIENAIEYAEESVTVTVEDRSDGYTIVVADDGPGIPDSELASLDAGTETPLQHGTGLGLWQLQWGITKLNGDLSFETGNGTTVRMTIPDQAPPNSVE